MGCCLPSTPGGSHQEVQDTVAEGVVRSQSSEGIMMLKAELLSMISILTLAFILSRWVHAVWGAIEIVKFVDLLGQYMNLSGSRVFGVVVLYM